ncbi:MAG: DUF418 domain-containing protein [Actinobacteria bacterium]|nr:DUF418 domain-containing protein [Actinomycetota bacterium]NBY82744.1 DUF418 domain-containing protein [Actinomycetota bacterium]NCZ76828.1 DUF418 domain-containing protein [Actinomycetota bacterium]
MPTEEIVKNQDRIQVLDVLRGFALAGILIINAMSILAVNGSTPAFTVDIPVADRTLQDLILFFIESKFFTLFSLLFGIGFAIQIQSAEKQGNAFLPRISRRMAGLLIFGLLHVLLLWDGDILVIYAITGTLLILFRKTTFSRIRQWVVSLLAVPGALVLAILVYTLIVRLSASGAETFAKSDASLAKEFANTDTTQKLLQSGFIEGIAERIHTYLELSPLLFSRIPTVLAMFLIGLYLGRSNFIRQLPEKIEILKKVCIWGLTVGFSLMFLIVAGTKFLPAVSALIAIIEDQYLAGPILCLGYASAITLAFLKNPTRKIYGFFSKVGRMALTNYLTQSLVLTFLAYGWGLGLALKLNGFQVLGISVLLYLAQVILSGLWLSKFKYGPFEWIWRCITYWKILSIRA